MPDPIAPSPDPAGTPTAKPASGNEPVKREDASPEGAADRYATMDAEALRSELAARNRDNAASKQEAERLRVSAQESAQKVQQYEAYMQQLYAAQQQQAAAQQAPAAQPTPAATYTPVYGEDILTPEEAKGQMDAAISGDTSQWQHFEKLKAQRIRQQLKQEQAADDEGRFDREAALASLTQVGIVSIQTDQVLAKKTFEKYWQIASNPNRSRTFKKIEVPIGNQSFNANMLREAFLEAKAEIGTTSAAAQAGAGNYFIEPGAPNQGATPELADAAPKKFSHKLLFDYELGHCRQTGQDPERYFKFLHPNIQEARLREGKPMNATQLGMKTVVFRKGA